MLKNVHSGRLEGSPVSSEDQTSGTEPFCALTPRVEEKCTQLTLHDPTLGGIDEGTKIGTKISVLNFITISLDKIKLLK